MGKILLATSRNPSGTLNKFGNERASAVALAALASTAAFAQSSVTISGQFAAGIDKLPGKTAAVGRTDGNVNFTAVEDLGGGMKVTAVGGVDLGNRGAIAGARNSSLTIEGGFGKLSYGTALLNLALRTGAMQGAGLAKGLQFATDGEASLAYVSYTSPELTKGLTVGINDYEANGTQEIQNSGSAVSYVTSTGVTSKTLQDKYTLFANYANGPLAVAADFRNYDDRFRATVSYDMGVAKAAVGYINKYGTGTTGAAADAQYDMEVAIPMGATTLGAQYVQRGDSKGTMVGAKYALSKRTSLEAAMGKITNGSAYNGTQSRVKLNHTF